MGKADHKSILSVACVVLTFWVILLTIKLHHVEQNAWNRWQQSHSFAVETRRIVEKQAKECE